MGPGGTLDSTTPVGPPAPPVLTAPDSVNLSTGNGPGNTGGYSNLQYWKQLSQNNIIQGQEIDIELGVIGQITKNDRSPAMPSRILCLFDFNQVNSSTKAYVENVDFTISAASLTVSATDSASITATDSSVVNASTTGGNNGNGEGYGGLIATNQVNGDAIADIYDACWSRQPQATCRSLPTTPPRSRRLKRRR